MFKYIICLILILISNTCNAYNISDLNRNVVRVTSQDGCGSGFFFSRVKDKYFILTNAHVIGNAEETVTIDMFNKGQHKLRVEGKIFWKPQPQVEHEVDLAIVCIDKKDIKNFKPTVIPLMHKEYNIEEDKDNRILSIGLPLGSWPMIWQGERVTCLPPHNSIFHPKPFMGQSGSPIFKEIAGKLYVSGIVTLTSWESGIDIKGKTIGYGISTNSNVLYKLMSK